MSMQYILLMITLQKSQCSNHKAVNQANHVVRKNVDVTGIGACACKHGSSYPIQWLTSKRESSKCSYIGNHSHNSNCRYADRRIWTILFVMHRLGIAKTQLLGLPLFKWSLLTMWHANTTRSSGRDGKPQQHWCKSMHGSLLDLYGLLGNSTWGRI